MPESVKRYSNSQIRKKWNLWRATTVSILKRRVQDWSKKFSVDMYCHILFTDSFINSR